MGYRLDVVNYGDVRIGTAGAKMGGASRDGRASPSEMARMMQQLLIIPDPE